MSATLAVLQTPNASKHRNGDSEASTSISEDTAATLACSCVPQTMSSSAQRARVQAYLLNKAAVGATPFVARSLNSAGMDPGGSVGVRGHLRPVGVSFSQLRRFAHWQRRM